MELLTESQIQSLRENCAASAGARDNLDHFPVVKLFTPDANATWLFTELDEDGRLFGLCDLGLGFPEMGYASMEEIKRIRGHYGMKVERDIHFQADRPLSEYVEDARAAECITV